MRPLSDSLRRDPLGALGRPPKTKEAHSRTPLPFLTHERDEVWRAVDSDRPAKPAPRRATIVPAKPAPRRATIVPAKPAPRRATIVPAKPAPPRANYMSMPPIPP